MTRMPDIDPRDGQAPRPAPAGLGHPSETTLGDGAAVLAIAGRDTRAGPRFRSGKPRQAGPRLIAGFQRGRG